MKTKTGFTKIDGDVDFAKFERVITGRITRGRYKKIHAAVRKLDIGSIPVYSDYDCTGECCGQYAEISRFNPLTITVTRHYDY